MNPPLPLFTPKADLTAKPPVLHYVCVTCCQCDVVDVVTERCRGCWRVTVLAVAAARQAEQS